MSSDIELLPVNVEPPREQQRRRVNPFLVTWALASRGRSRIRWARVTGLAAGSLVRVRCVRACVRRFDWRRAMKAPTPCRIARRRVRGCVAVGGLPFRVRRGTRFEVTVSHPQRIAVRKVYAVARGSVAVLSEKCVSACGARR